MTVGGVRVVVGDDDADLRALLRFAMEAREGLEVVGDAPDAPSCLAEVARTQPDVVVLDLTMPGVRGVDLVGEVRERAPKARVVFFSGHAAADVQPPAGAPFVQKGGDLDLLLDAVEDAVGIVPTSADVDLGDDAGSARRARRFVDRWCARWGCGALADDAQIVVSELVANAVVHAGGRCTLRLALTEDVLRIEVADRGWASPTPQDLDPEAEHGRGLLLVSAASAAWGVDPQADGKVVWAELPRRVASAR